MVSVREQSKLAQAVRTGLGRVPFFYPTATVGCRQLSAALMSRVTRAEPGTKEVECQEHPAAEPATTPAVSGLGR